MVEKEPAANMPSSSSSPSLDMGMLTAIQHFLESQKGVSRSNKIIHSEDKQIDNKGLDNVALNVEDDEASALIKKKIKFSSSIGKSRVSSCKVIYMRKGFLIYEERRKYFPIYEEAVSRYDFATAPFLNFLINEEKFIFFFISVRRGRVARPSSIWR